MNSVHWQAVLGGEIGRDCIAVGQELAASCVIYECECVEPVAEISQLSSSCAKNPPEPDVTFPMFALTSGSLTPAVHQESGFLLPKVQMCKSKCALGRISLLSRPGTGSGNLQRSTICGQVLFSQPTSQEMTIPGWVD